MVRGPGLGGMLLPRSCPACCPAATCSISSHASLRTSSYPPPPSSPWGPTHQLVSHPPAADPRVHGGRVPLPRAALARPNRAPRVWLVRCREGAGGRAGAAWSCGWGERAAVLGPAAAGALRSRCAARAAALHLVRRLPTTLRPTNPGCLQVCARQACRRRHGPRPALPTLPQGGAPRHQEQQRWVAGAGAGGGGGYRKGRAVVCCPYQQVLFSTTAAPSCSAVSTRRHSQDSRRGPGALPDDQDAAQPGWHPRNVCLVRRCVAFLRSFPHCVVVKREASQRCVGLPCPAGTMGACAGRAGGCQVGAVVPTRVSCVLYGDGAACVACV